MKMLYDVYVTCGEGIQGQRRWSGARADTTDWGAHGTEPAQDLLPATAGK